MSFGISEGSQISTSVTHMGEVNAGEDPEFPVVRGANPRGGGAPIYDFAKFSEKMHEIETILGRKGAPSLDSPPQCVKQCSCSVR